MKGGGGPRAGAGGAPPPPPPAGGGGAPPPPGGAAPGGGGGKKDENRILVYLRVRRPLRDEGDASGRCINPILQDQESTPDPVHHVIMRATGKAWKYDRVFWENSTQDEVFGICAVPTLENVFAGYCGAVMAYGQTGTGKTHTMQGYGDEKGIIPRAADYIFRRIEAERAVSSYKVTLSFVQIYLDKLQDLWSPSAPEVNIDPEQERVQLPGLTVREVGSTAELMRMFLEGDKVRVTRKTKMNDTSSRGHAALIVNVVATPRVADGVSVSRVGKLVLIDLAGYERFTQTGIEGGIAMQEAKKINASLLALGTCVNALADKDSHVPFRNAKLTRLLKDCLGGTAKTSIICTIGPSDKYRQETTGTLMFGFRAMAVKTDAKVMTISDPAAFLALLKTRVAQQGERIKTMVQWWSRSHPNDYQRYVERFGAPDVDASGMTDEMAAAIASSATVMGGAGAGGAAAAVVAAAADADGPATGQMAAAREEFRQEVGLGEERYAREVAQLRARHAEQMEEARKRGDPPARMAQMQKANEEEIAMLGEQHGEHVRALMEQQSKKEMAVLLEDAQRSLGAQTPERDARVREMAEHLLETCESKNEMLSRLFELVCYREEELKLSQQALEGLGKVMAESDETSQREARRREEEYRSQIAAMRDRIRSGGSGGSGTSSRASAAPPPSSSSSRRAAAAAPAAAPSGRSGGGLPGTGAAPPIARVPPGSLGGQLPAGAPSYPPYSGGGSAAYGPSGGGTAAAAPGYGYGAAPAPAPAPDPRASGTPSSVAGSEGHKRFGLFRSHKS